MKSERFPRLAECRQGRTSCETDVHFLFSSRFLVLKYFPTYFVTGNSEDNVILTESGRLSPLKESHSRLWITLREIDERL